MLMPITPTAPRRSTFAKGVISAAALLIALVAAACGASQPASRGTIGALRGKSAAQALKLSLAAARGAGSVKRVEAESDSGKITTVTGVAGAATGTERFTIAGSQPIVFTLSLIGSTVYMQANEAALGYALGASAAKAHAYAGRWISVTSADSGYHRAEANLKISFQLSTMSLSGPIGLGVPTVIRGQSVVGITGTVISRQSNVGKLSATLYVSTTAPFLPVELLMRNQSSSIKVEISYSSWGKSFKLSAPRNAVPISSVQPSAAKK